MPNAEILTLQFGHYSNHIGTHWWNLQESNFNYNPSAPPSELNHDVLYRQGSNQHNQTTYTPRLLLVDLKNTLFGLSQAGELYPEPQASLPFEPEVIQAPKIEKNQFQADLPLKPGQTYANFEQQVRTWSDYLSTRLHPRSIDIINRFEHGNNEQPFDCFPLGTETWKTIQFSEDFADKVRLYIEECDHFAGFQFLFDALDAFGGLTASCLEYLSDEYTSKTIIALPTIPYLDSAEKAPIYAINHLLSLDALKQHAHLTIPLSILGPRQFKSLVYNPFSLYQSSAIIATALDTFTLPYRLKSTENSLIDLAKELTINGRQIAAASLNFPLDFQPKDNFLTYLDRFEGPLSQSISPNCEIVFDNTIQVYSARISRHLKLKNGGSKAETEMAAFNCNSFDEMLKFYLDCTCIGSRSHVSVAREDLSVKTPYPSFFQSDRISAISGLHSGAFVGRMLAAVIENSERVKFKRFEQFKTIDFDDYCESVERMNNFADCYNDNDYLI